jgi:hypothetical protein
MFNRYAVNLVSILMFCSDVLLHLIKLITTEVNNNTRFFYMKEDKLNNLHLAKFRLHFLAIYVLLYLMRKEKCFTKNEKVLASVP